MEADDSAKTKESASRAADERRWSEWMARANSGDREAYGDLMGELGEAVEAYLRARFGLGDILEDCVQEALLAVHRARHTYDERRPFRPWLFTIVRRKTIDHFRRLEVRERAASRLEAEQGSAPSQDPVPSLDGARLLARLAPDHREALALTKLAGFSLAEAARRSGVSESAMKSRVHRALRQVRRLLRQEEMPS